MSESKEISERTLGGGELVASPLPRIDLSRPRYDQSTYAGRARHFFETTNPLNAFSSHEKLDEAAKLVTLYKKGEAPPGTTEEELWRAKRLYDSAYHPDTGEKMFLPGRMSFQVPGNMTITGLMLTFYKHPAAVIFWQWANQSFNATVNYTNRSGDELITTRQLAVPYVAATGAATTTALALNVAAKRLPPLMGRFVPFVAVAAANSVNIPMMRQRELQFGIPIVDQDDNRLGMSKKAARKAIVQVVLSRIALAFPVIATPAVIMDQLEKRGVLKRMPWITAPLQIGIVGLCLAFATPLCCAIFPQRSSISVSHLEPELRASLQTAAPHTSTVYYNKGL